MADEINEEVRIDNNPDKKFSKFRKVRKNPWMLSTSILAVAVVVLLVLNFTGGITGGVVSSGSAAQTAQDYVSNYFKANEIAGEVAVADVKKVSGMYIIQLTLDSKALAPIYMSTDGKYLGSMGLIEPASTTNTNTSTQTTEIPKTDKPKVELFVMAFCPYGVQAEQLMKPVYDLLKDNADFNIRYIVNVGGTTLVDVQSLHGSLEAEEDARQVCIAKYYSDKLWDYVNEIDNTCYPTYRTEGELAKCWKTAANKFAIDVSKIDTCVKSEAVDLLKQEETISNNYGVSGSPTLIINGVKFTGGRTSDAYKQAICSAFNQEPSECSQVLTSTTSSSSGGNCQ